MLLLIAWFGSEYLSMFICGILNCDCNFFKICNAISLEDRSTVLF